MATLLRGAGPSEQATVARILSALAAQPALRAAAATSDAVSALCSALARAVAAAAARPGRRMRRRLVLAPVAAANMCALLGELKPPRDGDLSQGNLRRVSGAPSILASDSKQRWRRRARALHAAGAGAANLCTLLGTHRVSACTSVPSVI